MPDKKPTDNDIVKVLEKWRKELIADYQRLKLLDAPMDCFEESHADTITKLSNALDLINRLQAENDELKSDIAILKDSNINLQELYQTEREKVTKAKQKVIGVCKMLKTAKAEARKEFAEKLKKEAFKINYCSSSYNVVDTDDIDNLLKELVGEENG